MENQSKNKKVLLIIVFVILLAGAFVYSQKSQPVLIDENSPIVVEDSIVGCYVATLAKDVYSLKIDSQQGESFTGTLVFKNFEKDSSSGTYAGTYKDGILLGDYSFQSEGMFSVMQVIFKKSGPDFIRGYGPVNGEGNRFVNTNDITFDSATSTFKASSGVCATPI